MTGKNYEPLLAREKPLYDGAEPSGNSIAVLNLLRLAELTGNDSYRQRANKAFKMAANKLSASPLSYSEWMRALDFYYAKVYEIVLVLPDEEPIIKNPLFNEIKNQYLPHKVFTVVYDSQVKKYSRLLGPVSRKKIIEGKPALYICEKGSCQLPAVSLQELKKQLKDIQKEQSL